MQDYATRPTGSDVGLTSDIAIPYGAQVTILFESREMGGRWEAQAIASDIGMLKVQCDRRLFTGDRFIVVRQSRPASEVFLHWVLLVEQLEELADQAEQRALKILRAPSE